MASKGVRQFGPYQFGPYEFGPIPIRPRSEFVCTISDPFDTNSAPHKKKTKNRICMNMWVAINK